jgi:hypothetical protein
LTQRALLLPSSAMMQRQMSQFMLMKEATKYNY